MNLFEKAARHFEARPDPSTGLRVLCLASRDRPPPGFGPDTRWRTLYHQHNPFLDGGRRILLRGHDPAVKRGTVMLDLETGAFNPLAAVGMGSYVVEVSDGGLAALATGAKTDGACVTLVEADTGRELNRLELPDWRFPQVKFLEPGLLCVGVCQGQYYDHPVHSRFYLLGADGAPPRLILDQPGFFCNHMMPRPGRPGEFSYDRWPCPKRPEPVVTRLRTYDGSRDIQVPLSPEAQPCGPLWGGQRDHYLWAPDGIHIVSYFATAPVGPTDHFDFDWWISYWNADTGREDAVPYPSERWGCNFAVSPDSRWVVTAGGRQFQNLYRVDLQGLSAGWNEQLLCAYPHSEEDGHNHGPFHMPHVLPDGSGALFCAGWPGPREGAYLVELPPS